MSLNKLAQTCFSPSEHFLGQSEYIWNDKVMDII